MRIVEEIEAFFSHKFYAIKTLLSIIQLETKLAELSIYPLLVNLCMLLMVLLATWLSSMFFIGYFVLLVYKKVWLALLSILLLNLVTFLGLLKYLAFNLRNMSYEKTREHLLGKQNIKTRNQVIMKIASLDKNKHQ